MVLDSDAEDADDGRSSAVQTAEFLSRLQPPKPAEMSRKHRRGVDRVNRSYQWRTNLSVFLKASTKFHNSSNKSHEFPEFFDILLEFCRVILFMKVIDILPKELPANLG